MDALLTPKSVHEQTQESFVKAHALMVKRIAYHLLKQVPPIVALDDLIQAGMLGLLEAVRNYDITKGASFETYAGIRIRGHMLDELRRNDWAPRSVYRNNRRISEAVKQIEHREGREAKAQEVAAELQLSIKEYNDMACDSVGSQLYAFEEIGLSEEMLSGQSHHEPHAQALQEDLMYHLTESIELLPAKEHQVIQLYYVQGMNLKDIGEILGVSESRISQIHNRATKRIRERLSERALL